MLGVPKSCGVLVRGERGRDKVLAVSVSVDGEGEVGRVLGLLKAAAETGGVTGGR